MTEREVNIIPKVGGKAAVCHLMPCKIQHEEPFALAKEYFLPTIRQMGDCDDDEQGREPRKGQKTRDPSNPMLVASFRGRPLQGQKVSIPVGYKGCIVSRDKNTKDCPKDFNDFTYWNWDELPSENDSVIKALRWINIAKAIHDDPSN